MTETHGQNYKQTAILKPLMPSVHPRLPLRHSLAGRGENEEDPRFKRINAFVLVSVFSITERPRKNYVPMKRAGGDIGNVSERVPLAPTAKDPRLQ